MRASYGTGYQASETQLLCQSPQRAGRRGCLLFGGRGQSTVTGLTDAAGNALVRGIADAGIPVFHSEFGNTVGWGNDGMLTRAGTAWTYQQTAQGVASDKVLLCGISMGSIAALRYAMANPSLVAAVALVLPVPDVQGMYDDNVGGFQAEIGTAYGARPSNGQNPSSNPASFAGIPMRLWYSTDDAFARPTPALAFATATGATATSLGAVGHTLANASLPGEVAEFLRGYAS